MPFPQLSHFLRQNYQEGIQIIHVNDDKEVNLGNICQ